MNEKLLHYIWKFQLYNKNNLRTTDNKHLDIIHPGFHNHHQGPDFSDARIRYDDTVWVGNIELHVNSSDWLMHRHDEDENYKNVILHVVWNHDSQIQVVFPTIELKSLVPKILLGKYELLMNTDESIPCKNHLNLVDEIVITKWKETLLFERLHQKASRIFEHLNANNNNWEEVCWWLLARNFGNSVNSDSFENIVKTIPYTILLRHKHNLLHLESLLLGQAGLLKERFTDQYAIELKTEYLFLKNKYRLNDPKISVKFLRMRPANFPSIRLVQLAAFLFQNESFFSKIINAESVTELKSMFVIGASSYWDNHYFPDEESVSRNKKLGESMISQLLINSIVVIVFAYGLYHKEEQFQQRALQWLEEINPETNSICEQFKNSGMAVSSAFDSQSLIQLKLNYCDNKKCLQCGIGNAIFRKL